MKKRLYLIVASVVAVCVSCLIGFKSISLIKENNKENKAEISSEISDVQNTEIPENSVEEKSAETTVKDVGAKTSEAAVKDAGAKTAEAEKEVLTAADKSVKSEIAKYVDTDFDFRAEKAETINDKKFNLKFSNVNDALNYDKKVVYSDDLGNKFEFAAETGRLFIADMKSLITEKTDGSIDKDSAQKIADEYAKTKCDIAKYERSSYESQYGYYGFEYTRYIGGYKSVDRLSVCVGYDGAIVYVSDFTYKFEGKNIDYTKEYIDNKIKESTAESDVDWQSIRIVADDRGNVAVSYSVPKNHATAVLPLG